MSIGDSAGQAVSSGREGVDALVNWFALNRAELPIGLAVAAGIVLVMLALRWIGGRLVAGDPRCTHWRGVIGHVLANGPRSCSWSPRRSTSSPLMPPFRIRIERLIDILLHGRLRPARRGVGARAGPRRDQPPRPARIRAKPRSATPWRSSACSSASPCSRCDRRHSRQSGRQRHGAGRRARRRRHCHRPRRARHFLGPVCRAFDPVRQALPRGNIDPLRQDHRDRRTDRPQDHPAALGQRRASGHLQRQAARTRNSQFQRRAQPPRHRFRSGWFTRLPPDELEKVPSLVKAAVEARKGCTFVRCAILGFGPSSIDFELLYDSRASTVNKVAADRTAVALAVLRTLANTRIQFAYPTQTTFTAAPDGTMIMPYAAPAARRLMPLAEPRRNPPPGRRGDRRLRLAHSSTKRGSTRSPTRPTTASSSMSIRPPPRRRRSAAPSPTASCPCRCCAAWRPTRCSFPTTSRWRSITASTGSASSPRSAPASACAAASPLTRSRRKRPGNCCCATCHRRDRGRGQARADRRLARPDVRLRRT